MEELIQWLCDIHPLTPECIAYLRKIVKRRKPRKGTVLLKIGDISENLYFIKKGLVHCFYEINGKPVSDWFFWERHTVVSIPSFYLQLPSLNCMETLEDCELYYITREEYLYLRKTFHEFSLIANVLYEKYLMIFHGYARVIRKKTAKERYAELLDKNPELIQRVAGKYVASLLGMDESTLSRGRSAKNRRTKKN